LEKEWRLTAYEYSQKYGWGVVVQEPYQSAYKLKNDTLKWFLVLNTVIFSFYIFVADGVIRAVRQLDKQTEQNKSQKKT
jgi:hypothetical protein